MSVIRAFGHWVPARVVNNEEMATLAGCDAEWIVNVSGIRERRWAERETTVVDLAVQAARACLERVAMPASDLGMIMVSSGSSERQFPGPAAATASGLGAGQIPAIDLPVASAGSIFGLVLASQLAPLYGPVLVIASEILSRIAQREPMNKNTAILFGDGAGAALILPDGPGLRVTGSRLFSDGTFADDLKLEFGQPIDMRGMSVILQASRKIPAAIRTVLETAGHGAGDADVFLMHQANQNLIDKVADAIGVESSRFYSNIARYGNTSSASLLIAASEYFADRDPDANGLVVFAGFGAGFHWGALTGE